ncbi:hypothetical protein B0H13DRAFT_1879350 [Mycena leptocephala]|nr:hypothetical protein B0H13DRAFT_1879350 [Mycena leptocephala]
MVHYESFVSRPLVRAPGATGLAWNRVVFVFLVRLAGGSSGAGSSFTLLLDTTGVFAYLEENGCPEDILKLICGKFGYAPVREKAVDSDDGSIAGSVSGSEEDSEAGSDEGSVAASGEGGVAASEEGSAAGTSEKESIAGVEDSVKAPPTMRKGKKKFRESMQQMVGRVKSFMKVAIGNFIQFRR